MLCTQIFPWFIGVPQRFLSSYAGVAGSIVNQAKSAVFAAVKNVDSAGIRIPEDDKRVIRMIEFKQRFLNNHGFALYFFFLDSVALSCQHSSRAFSASGRYGNRLCPGPLAFPFDKLAFLL
jgi:hypothetical protein